MAFLTLNGMALPVAPDLHIDTVEIGERVRAFDGTDRSSVRAFKREWKAKTLPLSLADADFWAHVLRGYTDMWSFDGQDLYSLKGQAASSGTAATYTSHGGGTYYGIFTPNVGGFPQPPSLNGSYGMAWRQFKQDQSGWVHYVYNSDGTLYADGVAISTTFAVGAQRPAIKNTSPPTIFYPVNRGATVIAWTATTAVFNVSLYRPAVDNGYLYLATTTGTTGGSAPTWPTTYGATVSDGSVVWTCKGLAAPYMDDVLFVGACIPAARAVELAAVPQAPPVYFASFPRLILSGDIVGSVATTVTPMLTGETQVQFADSSGTWSSNGRALEFALREV